MFEFIRGNLASVFPSSIVLDVHGIGYSINVSERTSSEYASFPEGEEVLLYVHVVIRENEQTLYGFSSREERECFRLLISFSGVGPKLSCAILNMFSLTHLLSVVRSEDIKTFSSVPGLGKKTAEKLMVDLKEKLPALIRSLGGVGRLEVVKRSVGGVKEEGIAALSSLGYPRHLAEKIIVETLSQFSQDASLEEILPVALKRSI